MKVLGAVEAGAPSLTWPNLSWHQWLALVPSAIALTLVTTAEGLLVIRSYSEKREYRTDPNHANPAIDVLEADGNPGHSLLAEAPAGAATAPGVVVIRMAAPLFFANGVVFGDAVRKAVHDADGIRHVVIDMEAVTDVDVTGAEAFEALRTWLRGNSVELTFSRVRADARDRLEQLGLLTDERIFETNRQAVAALTMEEQS